MIPFTQYLPMSFALPMTSLFTFCPSVTIAPVKVYSVLSTTPSILGLN